MSISEHLEELRWRLIYALIGIALATVLCLAFGTSIIELVERPYNHLTDEPLITLAPADAFVGYMKICLIAGLVLSSPWVFYQLWMFVSTGLYPTERKYVRLAVPLSAVLFVAGALFFLFVIAPLTLRFFLKFGDLVGVRPGWTFNRYISFVTVLMLVFGLGFQTPIAIFFLNKVGLVSVQTLRESRAYVFFGVFVVAAIATPPDVISQVMLGLPLYLLYELGLLLCRFSRRRQGVA